MLKREDIQNTVKSVEYKYKQLNKNINQPSPFIFTNIEFIFLNFTNLYLNHDGTKKERENYFYVHHESDDIKRFWKEGNRQLQLLQYLNI